MNYRHAYHAGNFADVLKHMVLVALIDSLKQKATPFCYIDTHAGAGRYDLRGTEARKTGEADEGFNVLKTATGLPPLLWKWLEVVRAANDTDDLRFYPGSPWIAAHLMREIDTAQMVDTRNDESSALRQLFHHDKRIHVHERDGYEAMKAFVPPKEKRGLVLIDPPFEAQEAEFRLIEKSLKAAMEKWPTGMFAVWYPIKVRSSVQPFHRWLTKCGAKRVLVAELLIHPDDSPLRLHGTGMAIINAPWKLDADLRDSLRMLPKLLGKPGESEYRLTWLLEEGKEEDPATQAFRVRREVAPVEAAPAPAIRGSAKTRTPGSRVSAPGPRGAAQGTRGTPPGRPRGTEPGSRSAAPGPRAPSPGARAGAPASARPSASGATRPLREGGPKRTAKPAAPRSGTPSGTDKPHAPRSPRRK